MLYKDYNTHQPTKALLKPHYHSKSSVNNSTHSASRHQSASKIRDDSKLNYSSFSAKKIVVKASNVNSQSFASVERPKLTKTQARIKAGVLETKNISEKNKFGKRAFSVASILAGNDN